MGHRAFPTGELARPHLERLRPAAGAAALVVVAVIVGWWLLRPAAPPVEASLPYAPSADPSAAAEGAPAERAVGAGAGGAAATTTSTSEPAPLVVQAAGAVEHPGVYELPVGSRVVDLVERAGGLARAADRRRINLAAPVVDGERVWLPARGEAAPPEVVAGGGARTTPGPVAGATAERSADAAAPTAPVDLNAASAEELDALPGVGPATASAILDHRATVGPFGSVEDLLEVRGIGEAKLEQLRPLVTVG